MRVRAQGGWPNSSSQPIIRLGLGPRRHPRRRRRRVLRLAGRRRRWQGRPLPEPPGHRGQLERRGAGLECDGHPRSMRYTTDLPSSSAARAASALSAPMTVLVSASRPCMGSDSQKTGLRTASGFVCSEAEAWALAASSSSARSASACVRGTAPAGQRRAGSPARPRTRCATTPWRRAPPTRMTRPRVRPPAPYRRAASSKARRRSRCARPVLHMSWATERNSYESRWRRCVL